MMAYRYSLGSASRLRSALAHNGAREAIITTALYCSLVIGLSVGYGDIAPLTLAGRVDVTLTGLLGVIITGVIVAVAVYALRKTMAPAAHSHRV